jgi:hypothetical protein
MMPGFEQDIKPLFRDDDIIAMEYLFDLTSYDDVKARAETIYKRISDGTMPCDEEWPAERLALLRTWIDEGMQP